MRLAPVALMLCSAGCALFCPEAKRCASNGAVVIRVVDADTSAPISGPSVVASRDGREIEGGSCPLDEFGPDNCRAFGEPGRYHVRVSAAGYVSTELDVEAERDICGDFTSQVREVGLQRLGTSSAPLISNFEGCGG
jgi:hypothetical protein